MRQKRPDRRAIEIADFEHGGQKYSAAISRFPNGKIAEVFLSSGKYGAAVHLHAQDSAVLCSLALQFGVPVETILHAVKGPIGHALALFAGAPR
jgi:hypothetical protein